MTMILEVLVQANILNSGTPGRKSFNVFDFAPVAPPLVFSKNDLETSFITYFQGAVQALLHQDWSWYQASLRFIDDALDPYITYPVAIVGSETTDRAPGFQAVTLRYVTGVRGRSYRGSKHFSPIAEADTDGDSLTSGQFGAWGSAGSALQAGFTDGNGNQWIPVVVSRKLSQLIVNPTNVVFTNVIAVVPNIILGTMRHRKERV